MRRRKSVIRGREEEHEKNVWMGEMGRKEGDEKAGKNRFRRE